MSNNNEMLYAVKRTEYCDEFTTIIVDDGGICEIHHNGTNYVTTYFQDRLDGGYNEESWLKLADGKQFCKDWDEDKTVIDSHMIEDALSWLNMSCRKYTQVDFDFLSNKISKI